MLKSTRRPERERLSTSPLFTSVPVDELETFSRLATPVTIKAGTSVIKAGTPGREAFMVESGELRVERDNAPIAVLGPGDFVGELSLLTQAERNADVVAAVDSRLLVMTPVEFNSALATCPTIARLILTNAVTRLSVAA